MVSELLNRKSASRSSQVPFHVVSLIPGAGFQKHFTVSVLQSYAPFNVGVFQEVGGAASVKTCVFYTSQLQTAPSREGGGNVASRLGGLGWTQTLAWPGRAPGPRWPLFLFPISPVQASMAFDTASGARAPCLQPPNPLGPPLVDVGH